MIYISHLFRKLISTSDFFPSIYQPLDHLKWWICAAISYSSGCTNIQKHPCSIVSIFLRVTHQKGSTETHKGALQHTFECRTFRLPFHVSNGSIYHSACSPTFSSPFMLVLHIFIQSHWCWFIYLFWMHVKTFSLNI